MGTGAINVDLKGVLENAGSIFSGFGTLLKDIRTAITGKAPLDPDKLAELEAKSLEIQQIMMSAQAKINEIEAASPSVWTSGWRPGIGWVCAASMAIYFIPMFTIGTYLWARQVIAAGAWIAPPDLGIGQVISLVASMLGLSVLRTYEKTQEVQDKH